MNFRKMEKDKGVTNKIHNLEVAWSTFINWKSLEKICLLKN